jgi:hypothetical protein
MDDLIKNDNGNDTVVLDADGTIQNVLDEQANAEHTKQNEATNEFFEGKDQDESTSNLPNTLPANPLDIPKREWKAPPKAEALKTDAPKEGAKESEQENKKNDFSGFFGNVKDLEGAEKELLEGLMGDGDTLNFGISTFSPDKVVQFFEAAKTALYQFGIGKIDESDKLKNMQSQLLRQKPPSDQAKFAEYRNALNMVNENTQNEYLSY